MSTPVDNTDKSSSIPLAYWGGIYSMLVAVLYLWGYWSLFGINILEHLGLSDVVNVAAYPILSVFVFFIFGVMSAAVTPSDSLMPSGGGADTNIGIFLRRHLKKLVTLYFLFVYALYVFGPIQKWLVLPALIALPLSAILKNAIPRLTVIKSEDAQRAIRFIILTLPLFAYGQGKLGANDIISGEKYFYILSDVHSSESKLSASPSYRLRYLGKVGNQYFLYSPESESVLITPASVAIELKEFRSKADLKQ